MLWFNKLLFIDLLYVITNKYGFTNYTQFHIFLYKKMIVSINTFIVFNDGQQKVINFLYIKLVSKRVSI